METTATKPIKKKKKVSSQTQDNKVTPVTKDENVREAQTLKNTSRVIQQTIINRDLKWLYPDDVTDTLSRKAWRQKARNEIQRLEKRIFQIMTSEKPDTKEAKDKMKKLKEEVSEARFNYLADPEAVI